MKPLNVVPNDDVDVVAQGESFFWFGSRETSLCRDEIYFTWLLQHGAKSYISFPNGKIYDYFLEEESSLKVAFPRLAENMREHWDTHMEGYERKRDALLEKSVLFGKTLTKDAYLAYIEAGYTFAEFIWTPWAVIFLIEENVIKHLGEDIDKVMALEEPIAYLQMQKALLTKPPEEVQQEYGWLNMYHPYNDPFTAAELEELKRDLDKKEIEEHFEGLEVAARRFNALLAGIDDPSLKRDVEIVHKYAFLKTDRMDVWRQSMFAIRPFYEDVAAKTGCSLRDATNLSVAETLQYFETGNLPGNLHMRSQGKLLYCMREGMINIVADEKKVVAARQALEGSNADAQELKGVAASPGKVRGPAKIINHSDDCKKVKEGDVFVARFTYPTFAPYMKKSCAVVTDEGGITSHAAVVSREFGVPCVIGVRKATKVLKDGDFIEVDAEEGVVRKL